MNKQSKVIKQNRDFFKFVFIEHLLRMNIFLMFLTLLSLSISAQNPLPKYLDKRIAVEERVKDALSRMTFDEKVRMCTAQGKFSSPGVPRLGIPELWFSDGPHGVAKENKWDEWGSAGFTNDSCTAFPALTCLAATWNPSLAYLYGKALGEEARYRKKNVQLAPGVNICRTPMNGRNFEYMGEDPFLASKMVVPYIQGIQENGVSACVKHFALNNQETLRDSINVELNDRALHEIYLPAFKAAVKDGKVWTIMGSYNKIRGTHATHNKQLMNDLLKGKWKFDGCVISDWGSTHNTMEAAMNGLDIEMGTNTNGFSYTEANAYDHYYLASGFKNLLMEGKIPMSVLDDKVSRILRLIFRTAMNVDKPWGSFTTEEHYAVARKIGEEGVVMLKNAGLLPITKGKYQKIAVIGENAVRVLTMGGGSSELKAKKEISPLSALRKTFGEECVEYSMGYSSGRYMWQQIEKPQLNQDSLRRVAVELAKKSDLVIYIGGLNKNYQQDSEGGDRTDFSLPFEQNNLIEEISKVNKNTMVVILSGNAVAMPWLNRVKAILHGWHLGSESGNILSDIICGKSNPSGKLPMSYPAKLSDCGAISFGTDSYPGNGKTVFYKEGILVGYRWYDTKRISPLFPFGYGLSYTSFRLEKPSIDKTIMSQDDTLHIKLVVKNIGKVKGAEVVQLYIRDQQCSLIRPEKELKAFQKIELEPGESKEVILSVCKENLMFYNDKTNQWVAENGRFTAMIGTSSRNIKYKLNFNYVEK